MNMIIRNIYTINSINLIELKNIYISERGELEFIDKNNFNYLLKTNIEIINLKSNYLLLPGLLDAHIHGQGGYDFSDIADHPECLPQITQAIAQSGVSYVMTTFISLPLNKLKKCLAVMNAYVQKERVHPTMGAANIIGVHLEGPFIAKNCRGAHDEKVLQDEINLSLFKDIIDQAPEIKQWKITLAPDLPGALNFIQEVKKLEEQGICVKVFIGHSNAEKNIIDDAVKAGIAGFTHLGNACQELSARASTPLCKENIHSHVVKWVLDNPELSPPVELIVDGKHLSRSFVSLIQKTIGHKIILVTDGLAPTGKEDGLYPLGEEKIMKENDCCYLMNHQQKKILAGSAVTLPFCIQQYLEWSEVEKLTDRIETLYKAAIYHPRFSSLSKQAIDHLPDDKNFVIIQPETGKIFLSVCNGYLQKHQ